MRSTEQLCITIALSDSQCRRDENEIRVEKLNSNSGMKDEFLLTLVAALLMG